MSPTLWTQPGETLSHNNACKEYGLEKHEIFDAIKLGKLQYKETMHMETHIVDCYGKK